MSQHHPGTCLAENDTEITDVPWALTRHLLSINHEQLLRATRHPFLALAANGTLSKPVIAHWLANDRQYLQGYIGVISSTLNLLRDQKNFLATTDTVPRIEARLVAWLESALQNGDREIRFFQEVADIYHIDIGSAPLNEKAKIEGLRRYETLFTSLTSQQIQSFLPWLEGATLLWATEKVYYDAFSWARRQSAQSLPRGYNHDQDGGAMRRELIPNWSNRDFLMFVEQLERIVNEGVSEAVDRDDAKWAQVKRRTNMIWQAVLDAEEAFWPDVEKSEDQFKLARTGGFRTTSMTSTLNNTGNREELDEKRMDDVEWDGHLPVV